MESRQMKFAVIIWSRQNSVLPRLLLLHLYLLELLDEFN